MKTATASLMSSKDHSKKAVAKAKAKNNRSIGTNTCCDLSFWKTACPKTLGGLGRGLGYRVCDGAEAGGLGFKVIGVEVWG